MVINAVDKFLKRHETTLRVAMNKDGNLRAMARLSNVPPAHRGEVRKAVWPGGYGGAKA